MISPNIDLGQLIIAGLIGGFGWFIKREITRTSIKLDDHEVIIRKLVGDIQFLFGNAKIDRRASSRQ